MRAAAALVMLGSMGRYHPGMAPLSRSDVEHVAYLARLGLTEAGLARLEGQLNHILDQWAILSQVDTEAIPPTAQVIELENILRDDVARPSLPVEAAIGNAAEHEDGFIVVPAILAE
jgi:aspartyl-tRNA(Asn)/glutamyl-tRNA(Gln) amidotransferase subunit C